MGLFKYFDVEKKSSLLEDFSNPWTKARKPIRLQPLCQRWFIGSSFTSVVLEMTQTALASVRRKRPRRIRSICLDEGKRIAVPVPSFLLWFPFKYSICCRLGVHSTFIVLALGSLHACLGSEDALQAADGFPSSCLLTPDFRRCVSHYLLDTSRGCSTHRLRFAPPTMNCWLFCFDCSNPMAINVTISCLPACPRGSS